MGNKLRSNIQYRKYSDKSCIYLLTCSSQNKTYKEFYILFLKRNEVFDENIIPGTPRLVISSLTGDIYFTNHYNEFINVKTGEKFK